MWCGGRLGWACNVGVLFGLLADPGRHGLDVDGAAGVDFEDWAAQAKRALRI